MPKETVPRQSRRHHPLHEELLESGPGTLRKVARSKRREKQEKKEEYVGSDLSKRILKIAQDQQDELNDEEAATVAAARGEFIGILGQMRTAGTEESESEGEYEEGEFVGEYADGEVVYFPFNPESKY